MKAKYLSIRINDEERKQLALLAEEAGHKTVAAYVRERIGLGPASRFCPRKQNAEPNEACYTLDEVAAYFNVTKGTVYRWMQRGALQFNRVGERRQVTRAELQRFVRSTLQAVEATK